MHARRRTLSRAKVLALLADVHLLCREVSGNVKISACKFKRLSSFSEGSFCLCTELILVGEAVNIGTLLLG